MTDIDSNQRSNTRIDQDNEKNVVSPKRGGNDGGVEGQDIEKDAPNKMDEQRRQQDEAQRLREKGDQGDQGSDKGINIESTHGLAREKRNS